MVQLADTDLQPHGLVVLAATDPLGDDLVAWLSLHFDVVRTRKAATARSLLCSHPEALLLMVHDRHQLPEAATELLRWTRCDRRAVVLVDPKASADLRIVDPRLVRLSGVPRPNHLLATLRNLAVSRQPSGG